MPVAKLPPPSPPMGWHRAVCSGVVDEADVYRPGLGMRPRIRIYWELETRRKDGKRFQVSRTYNNTLAVSGNLRRLLEAWLGRSLSYDEQQHGFNLRWLEGKNARLYLARNGPWVDVVEVLPPTWGDPELEIEHLVRWKSHRRETAWQDHSSLESSEASSSSPSGSDSSMIAGTGPTGGTTVPRDQD